MIHQHARYGRRLSLVLALGIAAAGCNRADKAAQQSADSTARNLTLAPSDTQATLQDVPAATPPAAQPAPQPARQPRAPAPRSSPSPAAPRAPATRTAAAGSFIDLAVSDTISSRVSKVGDHFTASVVSDVKDDRGRVVVPAGSVVQGTITAVKPAPNPRTPGTLTLTLNSVSVGGSEYPLNARIDSLETTRQGRGVTGGDAAKVGAGAAAGAILGRVLGKNTKGAVIGGIVGGAVGAGVAATSKDADIVLPKGAHINASLVEALVVRR